MKEYFKVFFLAIILFTCGCSKTNVIIRTDRGWQLQSDSTNLLGNNGFSTYQFHPQTGNLLSKNRFVGTDYLANHMEVFYLSPQVIDKTINFINAYSFYETRYSYRQGDLFPWKAEIYYTDMSDGSAAKLNSALMFYYDDDNRLGMVVNRLADGKEVDYTLQINYDSKNNVSKLEYEPGASSKTIKLQVTVSSFDNNINPYSTIPNWVFMMNGNWYGNDPEPLITALSKNNPLDYSMQNYSRKMTYEYNEKGMPVKRTNINKNSTGEYTFVERFGYVLR
jgi:hypothetical protein